MRTSWDLDRQNCRGGELATGLSVAVSNLHVFSSVTVSLENELQTSIPFGVVLLLNLYMLRAL